MGVKPPTLSDKSNVARESFKIAFVALITVLNSSGCRCQSSLGLPHASIDYSPVLTVPQTVRFHASKKSRKMWHKPSVQRPMSNMFLVCFQCFYWIIKNAFYVFVFSKIYFYNYGLFSARAHLMTGELSTHIVLHNDNKLLVLLKLWGGQHTVYIIWFLEVKGILGGKLLPSGDWLLLDSCSVTLVIVIRCCLSVCRLAVTRVRCDKIAKARITGFHSNLAD